MPGSGKKFQKNILKRQIQPAGRHARWELFAPAGACLGPAEACPDWAILGPRLGLLAAVQGMPVTAAQSSSLATAKLLLLAAAQGMPLAAARTAAVATATAAVLAAARACLVGGHLAGGTCSASSLGGLWPPRRDLRGPPARVRNQYGGGTSGLRPDAPPPRSLRASLGRSARAGRACTSALVLLRSVSLAMGQAAGRSGTAQRPA